MTQPYGRGDGREADSYPYAYAHPHAQPTYPTYHPETGWTSYPNQVPYGAPYAYRPAPPAPVTAPAPRGRRAASLAAVAAVAAAAVVGVAIANGAVDVNGSGSVAQQQTPLTPTDPNNGGNTVPTTPGTGNGNQYDPSTSSTGTATDAQQTGVVDIYTKLKYEQAAAAGTGMVLDSDGYILTNNHVIEGSTSIRVVEVSSGKTYTARVVGTAPTEDVAVLKLSNASGLDTANFGDSDAAKVGDAVTGVGNAGGVGGTPSAAKGKIQSLNETITASDESGTDSEKLTGVIVTDAPIKSGDSGGPLYNADDEVIGIDTAASTTGQAAGFAIPINKAMDIAKKIQAGVETSVIHIGYPAFMGVTVNDTNGRGALIATTEDGLPAAEAGIVPGDVVTSLDGTKVTSAASLKTAIGAVNPGDTVTVEFTDANGAAQKTQVTLITGPAD